MKASGSDRKSTRLNSSHTVISYAVFCLKKKKIAHTLLGLQFPVRRTLPVALVILGAYMLFDYLKRRRRREEMRGFDTNNPAPSVVVRLPVRSREGIDTGDFRTHASPRQLGSSTRFR